MKRLFLLLLPCTFLITSCNNSKLETCIAEAKSDYLRNLESSKSITDNCIKNLQSLTLGQVKACNSLIETPLINKKEAEDRCVKLYK